jgi:hypothetical protein
MYNRILIITGLFLFISCNRSTPNPSISFKADFSLSSKKYLKGDIVSINNKSIGLINQEWYDNGILFDNSINPSDKVYSVGKHFIQLIGKSNDGNIHKYMDSFFICDRFKVDKFKVLNINGMNFKGDSTKGHIVGFFKNNLSRFGAAILLAKGSPESFLGIIADSSFKTNIYFNNSFIHVSNSANLIGVNHAFLLDIINNSSFTIFSTSINFNGTYNPPVVYDKNINAFYDIKSDTINLKNSDFDIFLTGKWTY